MHENAIMKPTIIIIILINNLIVIINYQCIINANVFEVKKNQRGNNKMIHNKDCGSGRRAVSL